MATISIDYNSDRNEIVLLGDISDLQRHRYAWRYVRDYLHPVVESEHITIPVSDNEPFDVMSNISSMLAKYGFTEAQSESTEKIVYGTDFEGNFNINLD